MLLLCRALLLLVSLLAASVAAAQPTLGRPNTDVQLAGDAASMIETRELGIPQGAVLSRQLVRDLIQRLIATGRWVDVQVEATEAGDGVALKVILSARAVLLRVDLQGVDAVDATELAREVSLDPGTQLTEEVIARVRDRAKDFYVQRGYRAVDVSAVVRETDDPARKVLVLRIEEGAPTRIARITIEDDHPLNPTLLRRSLSFQVGDVLDAQALVDGIRRAELRMRRRGYLETTLAEPRVELIGTRATIAIKAQVGPLYEVVIRGNQPLQRAQVLAALELGDEPVSTRVQLDALGERLVETYRRRGYVDAAVTVSRVLGTGEHQGRAELRVDIRPGAQVDVLRIGFPGARHFEQDFLRAQVESYLEEELPGTGIISLVDSDVADDVTTGPGPNHRTHAVPPHADPTRTFYAPTYESALNHVEQLYQADGFLAATAGPVMLQRVAGNRAVVAIPITEGPRTMLYALQVRGNEAFGTQELVTAAELRRGMPFSYLALEEAKLRLVTYYKERGYLYAKIEPTVRFSDDHTRAEVNIEIVERYQVQVAGLVVTGATRTDESLIRDLVAFEPGDVYRPSVAQESEDALLSLGVFSSVTVAPEDPDLPARSKRVLVSVTQRPSQFIDLKAGLSTGQGARGGLEYGYRDLFGQALGLTVRADLAYQFFFFQQNVANYYNELVLQDRLERNVTLSLVVPRMVRSIPVRTSFELFHVRDNQRTFGFDKNGVGVGFTYQPIRRITLAFTTDFENNNIDIFNKKTLEQTIADLMGSTDPRDQADLRLLQRYRGLDGNAILVAGRWSTSYDHRDNPLNPARGYFASLTAEVANTLTTEQSQKRSRYLKLGTTLNGYIPIANDLIIALQARVGYIVHLERACVSLSETDTTTPCSQSYPNRAFFMGGVETVRGYYQDAMVPEDLIGGLLSSSSVSPNAFVLSGDAFILYRAELRFPIQAELHGAVFADLGNLWANPRLIDPFNVRTSVGAGLRLATPVGPLALDYGIVVGARPELVEPRYGTVHFSVGLF